MNVDQHSAAVPLTDEQIWGYPVAPVHPACPLRAATGGCPPDCVMPCPRNDDPIWIDEDGDYGEPIPLTAEDTEDAEQSSIINNP